ncbi:MAG: hypothetical protein Q9227_000146 [Pyrenula ochraceoflavens]
MKARPPDFHQRSHAVKRLATLEVEATPFSRQRLAQSGPGMKSLTQTLDCCTGITLWKDLGAEISCIREALESSADDYEEEDDDDDDDDDEDSGDRMSIGAATSHFPFSVQGVALDPESALNHSAMASLDAICQVPQWRLRILFTYYVSNVDMPVKILHIPSTKPVILGMTSAPETLGVRAIRLAICYAALTTISDLECWQVFEESRDILLQRYRFGTESTFASANVLETEDIHILQAMVIYTTALRSNENSRRSWTILGLAVRIAQALGLHREECDEKHMVSCQFKREMRRRLWWQLCLLDRQLSADRGSDPLITMVSFSTEKPANIDDEDLDPDNVCEAHDKLGFTSATLVILAHESFEMERELNYVPAGAYQSGKTECQSSFEDKLRRACNFETYLEQKYLQYCSGVDPQQRYSRLIGKILIHCTWLYVYRPLQKPTSCVPSVIPRKDVLQLATDILRYHRDAMCNLAFAHLRWITKAWVQWHALAVVLAELCVQTSGPMIEAAWAIAESYYDETTEYVSKPNIGRLWLSIKRLMKRARTVRQHYQASLKLAPDTELDGFRQVSTGQHQAPQEWSNDMTLLPRSISGNENANPRMQRCDCPSTVDVCVTAPETYVHENQQLEAQRHRNSCFATLSQSGQFSKACSASKSHQMTDPNPPNQDCNGYQQQDIEHHEHYQVDDVIGEMVDSNSFVPDDEINLSALAWTNWETFVADVTAQDNLDMSHDGTAEMPVHLRQGLHEFAL